MKAKDPGTLPVPPLKLELANDCPKVMAAAVGADVIVGVTLETVLETVATFTPVAPVLVSWMFPE